MKQNLENKLAALYPSVLVHYQCCDAKLFFWMPDGSLMCLDTIGPFNSIVTEHADDMEAAENLGLEDGWLFDIDDFSDEEGLFKRLVEIINTEM